MKNLSKMLQKSDLTAKDRILLRIHNDINEMKTGKSILTESDIYNIAEGWKPKDNYEIREYNKYLNIWTALKFVNMDMQTIYLNAVIDIGNIEKVLLYFLYKDPKEYNKLFIKDLEKQNQDEVLNLLLENTGFEYEAVLHKMTFDSIPKNIQKDFLALDSESETEPGYFRDEENLSKILKDKTELNDKEVNELVEAIVDSVTWDFENTIFLNERFFVRTLTNSYFAGVPMKVFVERMAKNLKISYKDEDELLKKLEKVEDIKNNFRKAVKDEISRGIFFSDHIPLCNSTDFATCNGTDTKLPHNEVLDTWIKAKDKNRQILQKHFEDGVLVLEHKCKNLFATANLCKEVITGKSMYESNLDLPFIKEYKKQIYKMIVFGNLIHLMKNRNYPKYYQNVLAYQELLKKVSILIEEDVTFMSEKYLKDLNEEIDLLNKHVHLINDRTMDHIYMNSDTRYYMEVYIDDMIPNKDKLKPVKYDGQDLYEKEVAENFGAGWRSL